MTVLTPPENACDCHAHVFGPYAQFPLAEQRAYDPPESPKAAYFAMLDANKLARGVLVHGGAQGWDPSAMVDALKSAPGRLRGIAVMPIDTPDNVLADLSQAGVCGMRFTRVRGPTAATPLPGRLELDDLFTMAPRLKALNWHAEIWANCDEIAANEAKLRALPFPVVFDHMGFFDVTKGVNDDAFQALVRMVRDGAAYVKVTMFRNSKTAPDYDDVRPFHDALVEANPDRLIWGSDFPFLGMKGDNKPTTESMLQKLLNWLPSEDLRQRVLVKNPQALYRF